MDEVAIISHEPSTMNDCRGAPVGEPATPGPEKHWLRGMILWTGGMLLALALIWAGWTIGTVAVPAWQARAALERFAGHPSEAGPEIERLGGPEAAARKVVVYLRLPKGRVPLKHRNKALDFLLACGQPAMPGMILLLKDPDEGIRIGAVELMTDELGEHMDERCVEPLIAALKERGWGLHTAIWALGRIGDPRALEPLRALLGDEGTDRTVCQAIDAILATQDSTSGGGK